MKKGYFLGIYKLLLTAAALILVTDLRSQDPQFSQYYANPVYTNPAFAGSSTVGRGVINYRSQWPSISGTFRTFSASYDEHYDIINGGIGIMITGDEAGEGTLRTLSLSGVYSYQIVINKYLTVRAGIQASIFQKSIEFGKLKFYDQIVKQRGFVYLTQELPAAPTVFYTNFAAGVVAYTNYFYGGFAIHNLNEPSPDFYSGNNDQSTVPSVVPMRYTGHLGLMIPIVKTRFEKRSTNLYPNILYMQQKQFNQLNAGLYLSKGQYVIGGYFRQNSVNSDAIIFLLGLRLPKLRLGFTYDATISDARPGARQSYEVSLAFELRKRTPKKTIRSIKCPEF
ncbi:MAG: PorP/SprF family type IX secretion system membrane protein [Bacteroidota bacterium]|jgi:type IX secretion system PorP/SprF family membrane protein|nr:PorP/SprF family type IX secretion system membrane protein [Sphingobacteriales bacterium]